MLNCKLVLIWYIFCSVVNKERSEAIMSSSSWTTAQAGATLTDTFSGLGTSSQRTRGCTGESDCSSSVVMLILSRCYIEGGDERDFKEIQFQPKFPLDSNSNGIDC